MHLDVTNLAYLTFLGTILADLKRVNRLFQAEDGDPFGMSEELKRLFKSFWQGSVCHLCCTSMEASSTTFPSNSNPFFKLGIC